MDKFKKPTIPKSLVFCGPSGSGKTTLLSFLLEEYNVFELSVSHTTRTKREGEIEGRDYFFVSKEEFLEKLEQKFFFEHEIYNKNYYGTAFEQLKSTSKVKIFDVSVEGVEAFKDFREKMVFVAVTCKREDCVKRIQNRMGVKIDEREVEDRLKLFDNHIRFVETFKWDLMIENVDLDDSKQILIDFLKNNQYL